MVKSLRPTLFPYFHDSLPTFILHSSHFLPPNVEFHYSLDVFFGSFSFLLFLSYYRVWSVFYFLQIPPSKVGIVYVAI